MSAHRFKDLSLVLFVATSHLWTKAAAFYSAFVKDLIFSDKEVVCPSGLTVSVLASLISPLELIYSGYLWVEWESNSRKISNLL